MECRDTGRNPEGITLLQAQSTARFIRCGASVLYLFTLHLLHIIFLRAIIYYMTIY